MKKILDTSVVIKWFVDEAGSEAARGYLHDFIDGKYQILFPTLVFYELGNACLQNSIPINQISKIINLLHDFAFEVEDVGFASFRKNYQNASEYNLTFYDASYITLMQKYNCEFITADKKMYDKVKMVFSKITLLI